MKQFKGKFKCAYNNGTKQLSIDLDAKANDVEEARRKMFTEFVTIIITQRKEVIFSDKDISYSVKEV